MSDSRITYEREDILRLNSSSTFGFEVIDQAILDFISTEAIANKSSTHRKTKRGCKSGHRHKRGRLLQPCITKSAPHSKQPHHVQLPSVLYTSCRSLNEWKLNELSAIATTYQPSIICLTDTWLSEEKEKSRLLPGYQSFYCHRKKRIGGWVGVLIANGLQTTQIEAHTTSTISGVWTLSNLNNYGQIIVGCIYHPPDTDHVIILDYITTSLAGHCKKYPLAKYMITGVHAVGWCRLL